MNPVTIDVLKLLVVFFVIIAVLWRKQPLLIAVGIATIVTAIIYRLAPAAAAAAAWKGLTSKMTLETVLVFYTITFLQRMMEKRKNLHGCQVAMNGLFNNRRINVSVVPFLLGCLPAAVTVLICGPIVREAVGDHLKTDEKAAITSYFRHISESFLPTYTGIFIAIELTEGKVTVSQFLIGMFPLVIGLFVSGWLVYLRRIPRDTGMVPDQSKSYYAKLLVSSIWQIAAAIALILIFKMNVYTAVFVCIVLNFFVNHFNFKEILPFFRSAFETKLILSTVMVMIFKEVLASTGIINELPSFFDGMPLPTYMIFALIFFFGSMIAGGQAIIVLCMPMAMAALGGAPALPMFLLLMGMNYVAMQISPVHICLTLCAEDYKVSLGKMVYRTLPMVIIFTLLSFIYYYVLMAVLH